VGVRERERERGERNPGFGLTEVLTRRIMINDAYRIIIIIIIIKK